MQSGVVAMIAATSAYHEHNLAVTVDKLSWLWPVKKCTATWTHELCDNQLIQHCWVLLLLVSLSLPVSWQRSGVRVEWGEAESVIIYPDWTIMKLLLRAPSTQSHPPVVIRWHELAEQPPARAGDEWRSCGGYKVQQCRQSASEELTASISS